MYYLTTLTDITLFPAAPLLGWSAGALDHVLSPHVGSFHLYITGGVLRTPLFLLIKSLCN